MKPYDFTYLSLGAGVQSTAVLVMSNLGLYGCPKADVAVFADTGDEPQWVYDHLEFLRGWSKIPVHIVSHGHLSQDVIDRHAGRLSHCAAIPAFTKGEEKVGILRRHCTTDYKINPIEKGIRKLLGYEPRQRIKESVRCLIGISIDEASRMKPSRTRWITNEWPLIQANLSRRDCQRILAEHNMPETKKSSCVFCPYHDNQFWYELKENHPEEFAKAVAFDAAIRDMSRSGVKNPVYLHRSCKPLAEVDFLDSSQLRLWKHDGFQNECEGICGV